MDIWEIWRIWSRRTLGPWGKLALGENEYLRQMSTWGNGHQTNGHLGKMGIWGKEVGYPKFSKGVPKCPESISPNVCTWAPGQMGTWTFWGKGYLKCPNGVSQVPCAHFPQIFSNKQRGK